MPKSVFIEELTLELAQSRFNNYTDNYDNIQLGAEPPPPPSIWYECAAELKMRIKELLYPMWRSIKLLLRPLRRIFYYYFLPSRFFNNEADNYKDISLLYYLLSDQNSRDLLVKIFAYRIAGHRKVRLPRNTPGYWQDIKNIEKYKTAVPSVKIKFMDASLALYDFKPMGYDLRVHATAPGSACAFVQKQYEYHHGNIDCKAEIGDIVIDAGGCWGETTLYFAHEVGQNGKVISFEFIPSNLEVMHANLKKNPKLADRVVLLDKPIWNNSGLRLYYVDWGPGSRVTADEKQYQYDGTTETISIDDMVEQQQLPRVDFIKMDIEGAEFPALRGAEKTIRAYRPKMAISLYHQLSDFISIPRYLSQLDLGYDFYLEHHTIYQNETVLFAVPRKEHNIQNAISSSLFEAA